MWTIFLAVVGGAFILCIGGIITQWFMDKSGKSKLVEIAGTTLSGAGCLLLIISLIGSEIAAHRQWTQHFMAERNTIESALLQKNEGLGDAQHLILRAAQLNGELAARQYATTQWWGFLFDKEVQRQRPVDIGLIEIGMELFDF